MAYSRMHLEIKRVEGNGYSAGAEKEQVSPPFAQRLSDVGIPQFLCAMGAPHFLSMIFLLLGGGGGVGVGGGG